MLDFAISRQNVFNSQFRLEPLIKRIPSMDAAKVEKAGLVQHEIKISNYLYLKPEF